MIRLQSPCLTPNDVSHLTFAWASWLWDGVASRKGDRWLEGEGDEQVHLLVLLFSLLGLTLGCMMKKNQLDGGPQVLRQKRGKAETMGWRGSSVTVSLKAVPLQTSFSPSGGICFGGSRS